MQHVLELSMAEDGPSKTQISLEKDFTDHKECFENTRATYAIEYIPNIKKPCFGPHPKNVIPLACDTFGVPTSIWPRIS
ncbi:hypothetical protein F8388_017302 [Cannabis sativa]|uniref:Uncharacterized protein n=1 Tax=Cannabis sativa TaxID=3483 RepID=A0A7J6FWM0_CANSA|nr:hypothetical protein F8388_017302 [Cannabis sativa]